MCLILFTDSPSDGHLANMSNVAMNTHVQSLHRHVASVLLPTRLGVGRPGPMATHCWTLGRTARLFAQAPAPCDPPPSNIRVSISHILMDTCFCQIFFSSF